VRIITATHRDLRTGSFRSDLLYRIEGVTIELPPLRLRRDDIAPLVARFVEAARIRTPRSPVTAMSRETMALLLAWAWPGNVRELQHAVERAVLLGQSNEATPADLPPAIRDAKPSSNAPDFGDTIIPVRELTRAYAAWAVERLGGRKGAACEKLGIDAKTLNKWLTQDGD
jgi:two-component system response regulator HydG